MPLECSLDKKSLPVAFLIGLFLTLTMPALHPSWRLLYFAPCLILSVYQNSLPKTLWLALLCGGIVDLLSSYPILGVHATAYCAAIFLLYPRKRHIFADSLTTLPLMTYLFSALSSFCVALVLHLLDLGDLFSWRWLGADLLLFPLADAFYAFALFIFPALLFGKRIPRGSDYFIK